LRFAITLENRGGKFVKSSFAIVDLKVISWDCREMRGKKGILLGSRTHEKSAAMEAEMHRFGRKLARREETQTGIKWGTLEGR